MSQRHLAASVNRCRVGLCTSRVETQHLAGIEMGACGLPVVAPRIGCYGEHPGSTLPGKWTAEDAIVDIGDVMVLGRQDSHRDWWASRFSMEACRDSWLAAVEHVAT